MRAVPEGSGALDDERLAGLDDGGARLRGRAVVLVLGQRAVGVRRVRAVRGQVRRGGVGLRQHLAVRQRHARPSGSHQPSL